MALRRAARRRASSARWRARSSLAKTGWPSSQPACETVEDADTLQANAAAAASPVAHLSMLIPLLLMALAFKLYYVVVVLMRARCEVLERERNTSWVRELAEPS